VNRWREGIEQLRQYPSAIAGAAIILFLILLSLYTVIAIPYSTALERWRGGAYWERNPINAAPVWVDRLAGGNLPRTLAVEPDPEAIESATFPGGRRLTLPLEFEFDAGGFPSELNVFLQAEYAERAPFVRLTWHTPDGRSIPLGSHQASRNERIALSQDWDLQRPACSPRPTRGPIRR